MMSLIRHHDRVRLVCLRVSTSFHLGKWLTVMQESFPELTRHELSVRHNVDASVFRHGFLG